MSRLSKVALAVTLLTVAMFAAFCALFFSPLTPPEVAGPPGGQDVTTLFVGLPVGFAVVGGVIAVRRPVNPIGWLMVLSITSYMVGPLSSLVGSDMAWAHTGPAGWVSLGGALWAARAIPTYAGLVLLLLLFPDGHLPSPRWRVLPILQGVLLIVGLASAVINPTPGQLTFTTTTTTPTVSGPLAIVSPLAVPSAAGLLTTVDSVVGLLQVALLLVALMSVFLRLRGADSSRRHQVRWFGFGALLSAVLFTVAVSILGSLDWAPSIAVLAAVTPLILIAFLAIPVSIAVAVLRYRLYDIDVLISRTLVYGALAVLITAVYVGVAVGIGALVGGGGKPNLGLSVLATAIVAVGFQPVRERTQRIANRLVYGKRATPYEVLSQFSERVAESYAADDVLPRMARVLAEGTGAQRADVWLRSAGTWHQAAVWPEDAAPNAPIPAVDGTLPPLDSAGRLVEVCHQGDLLGALSVTKRSGEALTPVEEKLLTDLAGQAGLVLKNVGLTSDLQARLDELRASRQRLVTAQDEERRRLERNLHDGAQQHLVALKVKLGLAEMLLDRDVERATETLVQLKADADEALATLRDLARGIYPPLLADKGLAVALESQARKATIPVAVRAQGVGRYSQDVEAAVYFSVLEALQNVQKYAQASLATVELREDGGSLHFAVTDDGQGFDTGATTHGSGLTNMADRIDALGGTVTVTSALGQGTRVAGSLPAYETAAADQASASRSGLNSDLGMNPAAPTSAA